MWICGSSGQINMNMKGILCLLHCRKKTKHRHRSKLHLMMLPTPGRPRGNNDTMSEYVTEDTRRMWPDFQDIHPIFESHLRFLYIWSIYLVVATMGTKHKTVTNMLTSKHAATWCRYETYQILRTNELVPIFYWEDSLQNPWFFPTQRRSSWRKNLLAALPVC